MRAISKILLLLLLACTSPLLIAKTASIEKDLREGKLIELDAGAKKFNAIYQSENPKADIAIILLHDLPGDPNDPNFIDPLRRALTHLKWPTLSIAIDKKVENNKQRLASAKAHLKELKFKKFVLLGYGAGGDQITQLLPSIEFEELLAIVLISAYPTKLEEKTVEKIGTAPLPILDIAAMNDFENASRAAKMRLQLSQKWSSDYYRQVVIPGADHYYSQLDQELAKIIHSWLRRQSLN